MLVEKAIYAELFSINPLLKYMIGTFFLVKVPVAIALQDKQVFTAFSPARFGNKRERKRSRFFICQKSRRSVESFSFHKLMQLPFIVAGFEGLVIRYP